MVKTFAKVALSAAVASLSLTALGQEVEFGLEEVVVTAQKRTESLQDVPISVTAISGELIQDALPYLSASEREMLISGTCDDCWQKMFPVDY